MSGLLYSEFEFLFELFFQVCAVASRDLKRSQEFAKKFNIPKAYGSYEEISRDKDLGL